MSTPVLLTGGTGTLGSAVLPRLVAAGREVRVLSRKEHPPGDRVTYVVGDLADGTGLDAAVAGVESIVHCAGGPREDDVKARHLVEAAAASGSPHVVHISVVGAERVPVTSAVDRALLGYFASKRAAELVVADGGLPWTTLRATQFHDLLLVVARALAKLPVVPVMSGFRFQPVDTDEVAARLVELALGPPAGLVRDLAGPRVYRMDELVRSYLTATGRRRVVVPVRLPGGAARAVRDGANLPLGGDVGRRTWEEFLAERVGARG